MGCKTESLPLGSSCSKAADIQWICRKSRCLYLKGQESPFPYCFSPFLSFIYGWLCWVFVDARVLSLAAVSGGLLFNVVRRLLIAEASPVAEHRPEVLGHSTCSTHSQQLWCTGLVAPWHVGSSWPREWTHVSCIGRWILNHWTAREVPSPPFLQYTTVSHTRKFAFLLLLLFIALVFALEYKLHDGRDFYLSYIFTLA